MMLTAIAGLTGSIGLGLIAVLLGQARQHNRSKHIKASNHTQEGFSDLLNYAAMVDDGVILLKNGAFMAAWEYQGRDLGSATESDREYLSQSINRAFQSLGTGWMLHIDLIRQEVSQYPAVSESRFPDPVSKLIDQERRQFFETRGSNYDSHFTLTVTYTPPTLTQAKFVDMMFEDDAQASQTNRTSVILTQFKKDLNTLENHLAQVLKLKRLKASASTTQENATNDAFLSHIKACLSGVVSPVVLPRTPCYLDALVGSQELWTGVIPRLGKQFIQVIAIDGFPTESVQGMLTTLGQLPINYRWSTRFIALDAHHATNHLESYRRKWRQKMRGIVDQVLNNPNGRIDSDAVEMAEDAESAIADINSGNVSYGYYTSVIVLMSEDREVLVQASNTTEKAITALGFSARVETINTLEAFMGSLPGHGTENIRRPLISTRNLADFMPTSSIWTGENKAPCPFYPEGPALMQCITTGSSPFRLNLHVRDLGHTLIIGPTGSGKSTKLGMIAAQLRRYANMQVFAFDKGMSMYPLCSAVGGQHYEIAATQEQLAFCPLQYLSTASDRSWAIGWIETLLTLNGVSVTPAQRNEIASAIESIHNSGSATLTDLSSSIQDVSIREALKPYTLDGAMGHLLDAETDSLSLDRFTVFEIDELMNLGERYALPVLLYLFRRIETALNGQPSVIILDEAWLMLGHKAFREKIREWLKTLRKANCAVILATQSLSDASQSGILDVIMESTATKIFLPNHHAQEAEQAQLYQRLGLNDREIDTLAKATPKRHYYAVSEVGRRLYEMALGPVALSLTACSDKENIALLKALKTRHSAHWLPEWFKHHHVNLPAQDLQELT